MIFYKRRVNKKINKLRDHFLFNSGFQDTQITGPKYEDKLEMIEENQILDSTFIIILMTNKQFLLHIEGLDKISFS